MNEESIRKLFHQVDQLEAEDVAGWFEEDAFLRVGLDDPVEGREAIEKWFTDFFADLDGIHHEIEHAWEIPGGFVVEARGVFRVRGLKGSVTIPGASVFRGRDGKLSSVRLYYDLHELREAISDPDRVFEGVDGTFPASDPPAWTG